VGLRLGKKVTQKESNPFRPKGPVTRRFTLAKVSTSETGLSLFEQYGIVLDIDDEPMFVKELESLIPSAERHYDRDREIWMVDVKHLDTVKGLACDWFERVIFKPAGGEEQILKHGSNDLTVPQFEGKGETNEGQGQSSLPGA
jgi:hypothetical protein